MGEKTSVRLNMAKFLELQGDMTEGEMAAKLNISRSHLWRIKRKTSSVGQAFIMKFRKTYPDESLDDYFFIEGVDSKER